jgi:hypothetical protein
MPLIKSITFGNPETNQIEFEFNSGRGSDGQPTLRWQTAGGYKPDKRVALAWGFILEDLEVDDSGTEEDGDHYISAVDTLSQFPPDD